MVVKIAIAGKAKSGKNTLASLIKDKLEREMVCNCRIFAFADPIKKIAIKMFPKIKHDWLWGPSENRMNIIPDAYDADGNALSCRRLLMDIGKSGRVYNSAIWVHSTMDDMDLFLQSYEHNVAIVSDLRFKEEFAALKEAGFYLVRIKRTDNANINDVSEVDLDDVSDDAFDMIIQNDDGLAELKSKVDLLISKLSDLLCIN